MKCGFTSGIQNIFKVAGEQLMAGVYFSIVTSLKPVGKLSPSVSLCVKIEYFYMHFDFLKGYTYKMKTTIAFFFFFFKDKNTAKLATMLLQKELI